MPQKETATRSQTSCLKFTPLKLHGDLFIGVHKSYVSRHNYTHSQVFYAILHLFFETENSRRRIIDVLMRSSRPEHTTDHVHLLSRDPPAASIAEHLWWWANTWHMHGWSAWVVYMSGDWHNAESNSERWRKMTVDIICGWRLTMTTQSIDIQTVIAMTRWIT